MPPPNRAALTFEQQLRSARMRLMPSQRIERSTRWAGRAQHRDHGEDPGHESGRRAQDRATAPACRGPALLRSTPKAGPGPCWLLEPGQAVQQRRLAGSARAHHGHELPTPDGQVDTTRNLGRAEANLHAKRCHQTLNTPSDKGSPGADAAGRSGGTGPTGSAVTQLLCHPQGATRVRATPSPISRGSRRAGGTASGAERLSSGWYGNRWATFAG